MTCRDMDGVINSRSRDSALPPEAFEHVGRCERCREVMRVLVEGPEIRQPSESGMRLIQGSLLRDLRPVRPLAPSSVFLAGLAISFLAVAVVGSIQLHAYGWNVLSVSAKIVVFASLALGAGALALSMAWQMRPGSKYSVSPNLLPAGALLLVAVAMMTVFCSRQEKAFVSSGLRCLSSGLKYAIPGAVLTWLWLRRGAAQSPKLMGATIGGFAGLIGVTVLEVHCPNLNLYHILVWHLGVLLLSALGGLALGATVEVVGKWRHYRSDAIYRYGPDR
jgi:hypothetical protein